MNLEAQTPAKERVGLEPGGLIGDVRASTTILGRPQVKDFDGDSTVP